MPAGHVAADMRAKRQRDRDEEGVFASNANAARDGSLMAKMKKKDDDKAHKKKENAARGAFLKAKILAILKSPD